MKRTPKTEYKTLSSKTKNLLAYEEGLDVEFKESIAGLEREDLVAFANSTDGGTIFIGIKELKGKGRQRISIKGCEIGDREKQRILNMATACVPPIEIQVITENTNSTIPIFRIEIPTGMAKPYCTSGGTYCTRDDGRKKPLLPGLLLEQFISAETNKFIERYKTIIDELDTKLSEMKAKVECELKELSTKVDTFNAQVDEQLGQVAGTVENAEGGIADSFSMVDETLGLATGIGNEIEAMWQWIFDAHAKLDLLLEKFSIEQPSVSLKKKAAKTLISTIVDNNPLMRRNRVLTQVKHAIQGLGDAALIQIYSEVNKNRQSKK